MNIKTFDNLNNTLDCYLFAMLKNDDDDDDDSYQVGFQFFCFVLFCFCIVGVVL